MPALTKQTLINLLIDSPLREPIKINLIDIVNNTNDVDLPKTYSTIAKELEIFQKATERRMKLADETIAKLKDDGTGAAATTTAALPPLPPMSDAPAAPVAPTPAPAMDLPPMPSAPADTGLTAPALDLPPLPTSPAASPMTEATQAPVAAEAPAPAPVQTTADSDEDALKEIQKELDALKSSASEEAAAVSTAPAQA
jgi:hypothetical protein